MSKVSDMLMDQQQEGVDELLCEIDHLKELLEEARAVCAVTTLRADTAIMLLRKFTKTMDMHVGHDHEIALCGVDDKVKAFLNKANP